MVPRMEVSANEARGAMQGAREENSAALKNFIIVYRRGLNIRTEVVCIKSEAKYRGAGLSFQEMLLRLSCAQLERRATGRLYFGTFGEVA